MFFILILIYHNIRYFLPTSRSPSASGTASTTAPGTATA
ncbi:hypothetical protein LEP1GSC074_3086 [Leptospira noguchii str. Hook]|nr:hypothetical protein LEP1GSC074_3086 [Leptospira noguchii str. Hook]